MLYYTMFFWAQINQRHKYIVSLLVNVIIWQI